MYFYPDEKIGIFVDGANLFATAKSLDFSMDFGKLIRYFQENGHLVRALYYTAVTEDQEFKSIKPLIDWLDYNGFTMVTKPTKQFTYADGRRKTKGNMDIELVVDALKLAPNLDHIVLFTGDGDFRALVKALQEQGKRVSVVSTLETRPAMIADELRRQADQFIDLADLEESFSRDQTSSSPSKQRNVPPPRGRPSHLEEIVDD